MRTFYLAVHYTQHGQSHPIGLNLEVTAEYPAIWSYIPEKAGYTDTQLSPTNALRMRNTNMSYLSGVGYAAM